MPYYLCLILFILPLTSYSQDIEKIAHGDIFSAKGNVSVNQMFYNVQGKTASRIPYSYIFSGNVNLKILDFIDAPFNFVYSNLGNQFSQPTFNQSSLHPTYKWIATHFGTISASYSPYTVSGHVFKGTAVDLSPGRFSFSALYGRFQKAIQPESGLATTLSTPAFKRMGMGFKAAYNSEKFGNVGFTLFHAKDQQNSIKIPELSEITPKENLVGSVQIQKNLFKKFSLQGEAAWSAVTEDTRLKELQNNHGGFAGLLHQNSTTALYKALKAGLQYHIGSNNLSVNYERVDPNYKTLGAYYFNNDLENITAGMGFNLFKNKIVFNGNAGLQHDNLDGKKLSEMHRKVGSANVMIKPGKKWMLNASYSNFLSYTNMRLYSDVQNSSNPYVGWDTLRFRQVAQNITVGANAMLHTDTAYITSLNINLTHQRAADRSNGEIKNGNVFYNLSMGYNYSRVKSGLTVSVAINAGQTEVANIKVQSITPVLSVNRPFLNKKLRSGITICDTRTQANGKASGALLNVRGTLQYTYRKMHVFNLSFMLLNRKDSPISTPYTYHASVRETTIMLVYSVNGELFNAKKSK